jgi:stage V sporulation protein AB
MFLNKLFLLITGLSGGIITAAGIVALINVVGIVPRLAAKTGTAKHIHLYETGITLGGTIGNLHALYPGLLPLRSSLRAGYSLFFALFSGIYIGCLIMALAETLQVMPIFIKHIRLKKGLALMLIAFALGKGAGSLWYFLQF